MACCSDQKGIAIAEIDLDYLDSVRKVGIIVLVQMLHSSASVDASVQPQET